MESPRWFSVDYALREINREQQLVTLDDILLFGVQGFLKIHMTIFEGGYLQTREIELDENGRYDVTIDDEYKFYDVAPIEKYQLQELRLNQSITIHEVSVPGYWGDNIIKVISFVYDKEIACKDLILLHEEFEKLRAHFFPKPAVIETPLCATERENLLAIIRALAEFHDIKLSSGAYRGESKKMIKKLGAVGIEAPCGDQSLAGHLKKAFSPR